MILQEQDCQHNQWPLSRIIGVDADRKDDVRSVTLRFADSNYKWDHGIEWYHLYFIVT